MLKGFVGINTARSIVGLAAARVRRSTAAFDLSNELVDCDVSARQLLVAGYGSLTDPQTSSAGGDKDLLTAGPESVGPAAVPSAWGLSWGICAMAPVLQTLLHATDDEVTMCNFGGDNAGGSWGKPITDDPNGSSALFGFNAARTPRPEDDFVVASTGLVSMIVMTS